METTAGNQLALALFDDLAARGESIESAPKELGFRRSNAFAKIVDLGLAARRLVDIAYFLVAETSDVREQYRVDYGLLRWLMCTTSQNRRHLEKLVEEAQKAGIVLSEVDVNDSERRRWGRIPLMGSAFIVNGEFVFKVDKDLQVAIKKPSASHFLNLRYVFASIYSKILFDRLTPYLEDGITPWFELDFLRVWMDCANKETYAEFKHFKAKVLNRAISDIKAVTGMHLEMDTKNIPGSKRVGQVRFALQDQQPPDAQKTAFLILKSLYETLQQEFGLNQTEINEIITKRDQFTDEKINKAIEYTRFKVHEGKVTRRAAGYLMKALREGWVLGELDVHIKQQADRNESNRLTAGRESDIRDKHLQAAANERARTEIEHGWEHFNQLPEDAQNELVEAFCTSQAADLAARRIKVQRSELPAHLLDANVHGAFGSFVASSVKRAARANRDSGV
ncbi:Protein involved in initiation of plasmid replication [Candidatus Burkholderia humilis]|nr:Protein involved in initiation of plasmid replication [Candidatus Burkholderia humilis]